MLIFESVAKVAKRHAKKLSMNNDSYCVQKFSNCNLLGWTFLQFFNRFELSNEFCALWNSYRVFGKYLYQHFFLIWKPNADETAQKNEKRILSMCLWIPFYIHFRPRRLHFVKKSKSLFLNVQYTYKACFYLLISCQMPEKRLQVEKTVKQFFYKFCFHLLILEGRYNICILMKKKSARADY